MGQLSDSLMRGMLGAVSDRDVAMLGKQVEDPSKNNLGWKRGMISEITQEHPRLGKYDWQVIDGDPSRNVGGGYLEFYSPDDKDNPFQGKPTIEVYPSTSRLPRKELKQMIYGDMLHYLPQVDPSWNKLRGDLANSFTDKQNKINRMAYQRELARNLKHGKPWSLPVREGGQMRPYSEFMDMNRLDAWARGALAPDKYNEWAGMYTPDQMKIIGDMRNLLGQQAADLIR